MILTGRWFDNYFNRTDMKYQFPNGSYIEFFSADSGDKGTSEDQKTGSKPI